MTWASYGGYVLFVLLVVLVPGPDTLVVMKSTLAAGPRGGLLAALGITMGNLVHGTAAALGLSALIVHSQALFQTLRWLGIAYLVFLGVQALRSAWRGDYRGLADSGGHARGFRRWNEGFLCNLTNPKVLVFYLSMLPQFLDPASSTWHAMLLAYTTAVVAGSWQLVVLFLVRRIRGLLARRKVRRAVDATAGTALLGFGAVLATE
ncbi:LysE family translocator [Amycolatopsis anabasis]|uniref:LysE family translocator n=1 Tax=Amycolatopsis anabasis TaxID=1840409 RepID=UPI00131B8599|nr:LysE family translocator [Amycolatopsis anabasis]